MSDEAIEGIKRAGHAVQRRHSDFSMGVGEAEDTSRAAGVTLLGASRTQQHPSKEQPGCPHGFGGEERAGRPVSLRAHGGACPALVASLAAPRKPA